MGRFWTVLIGVVTGTFVAGCQPSTFSPRATGVPYCNVQLGMPLDDARKHIDGAGEEREYDKLPVIPKPREVYPKLPADATWRMWSGEGKPTVVLGIVGGKVAYKQVIRSEGNQLKSEASVLPEYQ